jgi:hypothetical protein
MKNIEISSYPSYEDNTIGEYSSVFYSSLSGICLFCLKQINYIPEIDGPLYQYIFLRTINLRIGFLLRVATSTSIGQYKSQSWSIRRDSLFNNLAGAWRRGRILRRIERGEKERQRELQHPFLRQTQASVPVWGGAEPVPAGVESVR